MFQYFATSLFVAVVVTLMFHLCACASEEMERKKKKTIVMRRTFIFVGTFAFALVAQVALSYQRNEMDVMIQNMNRGDTAPF